MNHRLLEFTHDCKSDQEGYKRTKVSQFDASEAKDEEPVRTSEARKYIHWCCKILNRILNIRVSAVSWKLFVAKYIQKHQQFTMEENFLEWCPEKSVPTILTCEPRKLSKRIPAAKNISPPHEARSPEWNFKFSEFEKLKRRVKVHVRWGYAPETGLGFLPHTLLFFFFQKVLLHLKKDSSPKN